VIARLNRDIAAMLHEPDVVSRFRAQGVEVVASTPEAFATLVRSEIAKWGEVVRSANVKVD
jgi:tripartite-type tricarboxylate transporter receptor subunit TctC